jgi:hypothetical protein
LLLVVGDNNGGRLLGLSRLHRRLELGLFPVRKYRYLRFKIS